MTFQYVKIDHVQLAAPRNCEQEAIAFYHGILGFRILEKPDTLQGNGGVWFQAGDVQLHIGIDEAFSPARKAHPAISLTNLEALSNHLSTNGIPVIHDSRLPGANRFYLSDPFGNRIEFLEWK
ncbi:MAG: VOC family protein [Bacillota bacterium]|uniref:VOC family protein n=1 Tax=Virgibacillus salarius TaxID=447199 RepID=A0A941DW87_9BACI|nr:MULTISPECIES: VOC family protein [Bacillaceae]NAZ07355.1 glyoxalase [Agaribacter marinus]MBR7794633.1 VOC family protein [Virgibacillus salarius]MCC2250925.1 VOC family protein [Virgibacillus sp. AGTR]MDY7044769.1 VOC family protein [Virgibacillus sp. M23]QRZ16374.1 VOC family protein [Virgibacillus sp. AGTR]